MRHEASRVNRIDIHARPVQIVGILVVEGQIALVDPVEIPQPGIANGLRRGRIANDAVARKDEGVRARAAEIPRLGRSNEAAQRGGTIHVVGARHDKDRRPRRLCHVAQGAGQAERPAAGLVQRVAGVERRFGGRHLRPRHVARDARDPRQVGGDRFHHGHGLLLALEGERAARHVERGRAAGQEHDEPHDDGLHGGGVL